MVLIISLPPCIHCQLSCPFLFICFNWNHNLGYIKFFTYPHVYGLEWLYKNIQPASCLKFMIINLRREIISTFHPICSLFLFTRQPFPTFLKPPNTPYPIFTLNDLKWLRKVKQSEWKSLDSWHSIYLPHNCGLMYLKAFSPGQQYKHHWGTCQKCKLLDATSDLLNQILRVGPSNLCFSRYSRWFWWGLWVCESMHLGLLYRVPLHTRP